MLFYKIKYQTAYSNRGPITNHVIWEGSAKDASAKRKSVRQTVGYIPSSVKTDKINIPTDKINLLEFLNSGGVLKTD